MKKGELLGSWNRLAEIYKCLNLSEFYRAGLFIRLITITFVRAEASNKSQFTGHNSRNKNNRLLVVLKQWNGICKFFKLTIVGHLYVKRRILSDVAAQLMAIKVVVMHRRYQVMVP